jgi:histidinol dehydrogenase
MAYGMEGLAPVDVIAGAGNKYVAEAKKQIYGTVASTCWRDQRKSW